MTKGTKKYTRGRLKTKAKIQVPNPPSSSPATKKVWNNIKKFFKQRSIENNNNG